MKSKIYLPFDEKVEMISTELFKGTKEQATVYFEMKYADFKHACEFQMTFADDVNFNGTIEEIEVSVKNKPFFNSLNLNDDENTSFISNIGERKFSLDQLMLFTNFELKTKCSKCFDTGQYKVVKNCGVPDSQCCGGCEETVECDDHEVEFDLNF